MVYSTENTNRFMLGLGFPRLVVVHFYHQLSNHMPMVILLIEVCE